MQKHVCVSIVASALLIGGLACGVEQDFLTDDDISEQGYAFRHGPPPGPPPYDYFLTSYGDPHDPDRGTPACGGRKVDGNWYYSTGAFTYGCGTLLKLEANQKCVVVKVVDNGPAAWVEEDSKEKCGGTGYIIDASPVTSKYLYGSRSAGWSDCFEIKVSVVAGDSPMGPVPCTPEEAGPGIIGDPCEDADSCASGICKGEDEGFPGGMCSEGCTDFCPDEQGRRTFCVAAQEGGTCIERCDYLRYSSGCRSGYTCKWRSRFSQPGYKKDDCEPVDSSTLIGLSGELSGDPDVGKAEGGGISSAEYDAMAAQGCATIAAPGGFFGSLLLLLILLPVFWNRPRIS